VCRFIWEVISEGEGIETRIVAVNKTKLQIVALVLCLIGQKVWINPGGSTAFDAFLMTFFQIHGIALFAKTKGRSCFYGLFGTMPFYFILGIVLLAILKERKELETKKDSQAIWSIIFGVIIIVTVLIYTLTINEQMFPAEAGMIFMSTAWIGYLFYLQGLNPFITKATLGIKRSDKIE
jgi:hypothetical protein